MTRCLCSAVGIQPGLESVVRLISLVLEDNSNVRATAPVTIPLATIIAPATPNNFIIGVHTLLMPLAIHEPGTERAVILWSACGPTRKCSRAAVTSAYEDKAERFAHCE